MAVDRDLIELLQEFAAADVRYLLIGGHAVGFHAVPRFTKDVDFWLQKDGENIDRTERALRRFGAPEATIQAIRGLAGLDVAWMGTPPLRFDFMLEVPGGDFDQSYARRVSTQWETVAVTVVSAEDLLRLKRASGRPQDLLDIAAIEAALKQHKDG